MALPKFGSTVIYVAECALKSSNRTMQPFNGEPMAAIVTGYDDNGDLFLDGLPNEKHVGDTGEQYDRDIIKLKHIKKSDGHGGRYNHNTWVPLSALSKQV